MSSSWTALHAQLVRSFSRRTSLDNFHHLTQLAPDVPVFRDPHAVLDWFHDRSIASDLKNAALRQLVVVVQSDGRPAALATELMLLALWPGLSTVRARLRVHFRSEMYLLDAELIGRLSADIGGLNLDKVNKIAATLLLNLERDLKRIRLADSKVLARAPEEFDETLVDPESEDDARLMRTMVGALGDDGAILAAVHIGGWSQKEVAQALGISHGAARKRCQRAMKKLRAACPTDDPKTAFL